MFATPARAQTTYWWDANGGTAGTGGTGNWDTTSSLWRQDSDTGSLVPWGNTSTSDAVFAGTSGTVTLTETITANDLTFSIAGYLLQSGTLALAGTTPTISVSSGTATITSLVTRSATLVKTGTGILAINSASTGNDGAITVSQGGISITDVDALGGAAANTITFGDANSGANALSLTFLATTANTVNVANNMVVSANGTGEVRIGRSQTANGVVTYTGSLTLARGVTLFNNGSTQLRFSGPITGTGDVTIGSTAVGNALILNPSNNVNTFTGNVIISNNAQLQLGVNSASGTNFIPDAASVLFRGSGSNSWLRISTSGETIAGLVSESAGVGRLSTNRTTAVGSTNYVSLTLAPASGATYDYSGSIFDQAAVTGSSWAFNITKAGAGTQVLGGINTYTGTTAVTAGTLRFSALQALYNGGTSSWTAANLVVSAGATAAFNVGGAGEFDAGHVAQLAGLGTASGGFTNGSILGLDTTDAGGDFTYGTVIADPNGGANSLGLAKLGTGTLTLTANNTYTGTTTVSAGVLRLGAGGASGSVAGTIDNAAALVFERSDAITYAGGISGSGSVAQVGSGTLTFTGSNSYTGPTSVDAGTLQLGNGGTSGTMAAGSTVTVASGARFRLYRSDSFGFSSPLAGSGTVSLAGTGVSAQSSYSITGNNSAFTGTFIVESGARFNVASNDNAVGNAAGIDVASGGQFFTNRSTSRPFTIAGNGWQESQGQLGAIRLASNAILSGTITLAGNSRISVSVNNSGTVSGPIVGGFQLELGLVNNEAGIRTLTLSGSNSYSGGTLVSGSMVVNANNSYAFGSGAVTLGGTATHRSRITLDDGVNVGNALTLAANAGETARGILEVAANESGTWSGPITISSAVGAGGQFYTGTNGSLTLAGPITSAIPTFGLRSGRLVLSGTGSSFTGLSIADGRLVLGAANTLPTTAVIGLGASSSLGIIDLAGFDATIDGITQSSGGTGQVTNSAATPSVLTLSSPTNRSYAGTIDDGSGGVSLVKQGTGVLTLAGVNTFVGPTAIEQGRLALGSTGALASGTISTAAGAVFDVSLLSGGLLLAGNQTLAGSGTVVGSFTVADGATLSPGSSPGILTGTAGTITWGNAGNYNWQIHTVAGGLGTGWDFLDSSGALVITATSGGFNINLWSLSGIGPDVNGNVADFNANNDSHFLIAEFDDGITGWNPAAFSVNTTAFNGTGGFTNSFDGAFTVARGDTVDGGNANQIYLVYAAVPEPTTLALAAAGLGALGVAALRRRRATGS